MMRTFFYSLLFFPFCFFNGPAVSGEELPPKIREQVQQIVKAYQSGSPFDFTQYSTDLIKQAKADQLESIDEAFAKQKLPPLKDMVGEVRIHSIMANVNLPRMTWHEFAAVLPFLDGQAAQLTRDLETSEFFVTAVPPENLKAFDEKFWKLHVFRNRLNALGRTAEHVQKIGSFYQRQIEAEKKVKGSTLLEPIARLPNMASRLFRLRNLVDEREAELRVHRTTEAEANVDVGQEFEQRLNAAYALADDRLFFEQFFATVKKENRELVNQDLKDESILKMVSETSENASKEHKALFDKAKLLYVGAHWWLRGRYGRGPLGHGLLKAVEAGKSPEAMFPLLMPAKMPAPEELVGNKAPFQPVRRHNYVWGLGVDRFQSSGPSMVSNSINKDSDKQGGKGKTYRAKIKFNRFY